MENIEVGQYDLKNGFGKHIRQATYVKFPTGEIVRFVEKTSKKWAIKNARELLTSPYYEADYA